MIKKRFIVIISLFIVSFIGCSNANEKANKLFIEANKLYESKGLDNLNAIVDKLDLIIKKYPGSDTAVKLIQGELTIGGDTYEMLKFIVSDAVLHNKAKTEIEKISRALDLYAADNGQYPTTEQGLDALIKKPILPPKPKAWKVPYIESNCLIDPWGCKYIYAFPGTHEGYQYDLCSFGPIGFIYVGEDTYYEGDINFFGVSNFYAWIPDLNVDK